MNDNDIDIFKLLKEGFILWRNNLRICIPFIWAAALSIIISLTILLILTFNVFAPIISIYLTDPAKITSTDVLGGILQSVAKMLIPIIMGVVVIIISLLVIYSFFTAGAIGMIKELLQTGETDTSTMWNYGKRKMISVLGANVILGLLAAIGFIFLIPGFLSFISFFSSYQSIEAMSSSTSFRMLGGLLFFLLGISLMVIYIACISIIFALVQYAIVIDDLQAFEGIKKGFHVFWHGNKINVFSMWIIILLLSVPLGVVQNIPWIGFIVYLILLVILWAPLTTIWWSKLYLTIKKE